MGDGGQRRCLVPGGGADPRSVIDAFGDQSRGALCVQVCVVSSQPPLGMLSM